MPANWSYPEHAKLRAVKEESQAQGAFLEWLLNTKGYHLATQHVHTEEACGDERGRYCERADELEAVHARTEISDHQRDQRHRLSSEVLAHVGSVGVNVSTRGRRGHVTQHPLNQRQ